MFPLSSRSLHSHRVEMHPLDLTVEKCVADGGDSKTRCHLVTMCSLCSSCNCLSHRSNTILQQQLVRIFPRISFFCYSRSVTATCSTDHLGRIMATMEGTGDVLYTSSSSNAAGAAKDVQTSTDGCQTDQRAAIIDGKAIADQIRKEIADEVAKMEDSVGNVPGLAVILVGARKDSLTYVRSKKKACTEVGIQSFDVTLPEDATEEEVVAHVKQFNDNPAVHGILVQLPLPKHINEEAVLGAVSYEKDVDGFHPINVGTLAMQGRKPLFVSCTPKGCIELLKRSGVQMKGKRAVVIGRSNIVGTPAAQLLQRQNATVTVVHSQTPNPAEITREADIVVAAVGKAELVRGDWLKPGAVVIDVGINAVEDLSIKKGYRLVGDVCFEEACQVASMITPVPGGVGPMTIAMLLSNTLEAAKRTYGVADA